MDLRNVDIQFTGCNCINNLFLPCCPHLVRACCRVRSALAAAAEINDGDCTSTGGDLFVLELAGAVEVWVGL